MRAIFFIIILILLSFYWLIDGSRAVYQNTVHGGLQEKTLEQIVKERPSMGYFKITGGHFDYSQAVVEEVTRKTGTIGGQTYIRHAFIPYIANNEAVTVIASTEDPDILEALQNHGDLPKITTLTGEVDRGNLFGPAAPNEFEGHTVLNEPVVMIRHNGEPSLGMSLLEFFGGLVGTGLFLNYVRRYLIGLKAKQEPLPEPA